MAKKIEDQQRVIINGEDVTDLSPEELQKRILQIEYQTKALQMGQADRANRDYLQAEARRHEANARRMIELKIARENHLAVIKKCKHRSGGSPRNILRGGGKFSFCLVSRSLMPDGVTILLHCQRCRLQIYTPRDKTNDGKPAPRQLWFKTYDAEKVYFDKLVELSEEDGCSEHNEHRGPTFLFQKDGVPFIPDRV